MRLRLATLMMLTVLFIPFQTRQVTAAPDPLCFNVAGITNCVDPQFRPYWEANGGLPIFGYPLSGAQPEQTADGLWVTQHFERNRLEFHPDAPDAFKVQLGRLGAERLQQLGHDWQQGTANSPQPGCRYFTETRHNLCEPFLSYWRAHGLEFGDAGISDHEALALWGLPLTEPQREHNSSGDDVVTQWFERARLEEHGTNGVLLGLLGREFDSTGIGQHQTPAASTPAPPTPPGGFIQASGSQLTRLGQAVQLKGVNYYPQDRPWLDMWATWNGPQVARELRLAREQLGINAVRVLLPYDSDYARVYGAQVSAEQLGRLREMVQIAGGLELRVIVTLFDFDQVIPSRGGREEQQRLAYLRTLLGNFVGDDRIAAWDIHNEPDQYDGWKQGNAPAMLDWLGRIADEVHRDAPNHLVTVGMGYYENLLRAGPDGRRPIDYSDMISVHSYNSLDLAREIDVLRGSTSKPLVLEEFGWPTGITCLNRSYNEAEQAQNYHDALAAATGRVAGAFAWTLRDFDPGPSSRWDTREEHYGLYRIDDSLKPAAVPFQAYPGTSSLPSLFHTDLPLTEAGPNPIDGPQAPKLVAGTGFYVKGLFRQAWDLLGGAGSFGPPITEAFIIPGDVPTHDRVVQYFAAGALELHPAAAKDPDFLMLDTADQIKRLVVPVNVGSTYAAGRVATEGGHGVADIFSAFYRGIDGTWRLGAPITGALTETLNGATTTVQYFQNGRLQVNPTTGVIEGGNLGQLVWQASCDAAP